MGIAFPFCNAALSLLVIASLCKTTFTDPGIIPRATSAELTDEEQFDENSAQLAKSFVPHAAPIVLSVITALIVLTTTVHGSLLALEGELPLLYLCLQ
ncbi:hypothetical protein T08_10247 [Trichinella sp. T8]|nr:hypothetical protein T08_10247 [Trichinella sp. T8]